MNKKIGIIFLNESSVERNILKDIYLLKETTNPTAPHAGRHK